VSRSRWARICRYRIEYQRSVHGGPWEDVCVDVETTRSLPSARRAAWDMKLEDMSQLGTTAVRVRRTRVLERTNGDAPIGAR
jgi:hypothetical protein